MDCSIEVSKFEDRCYTEKTASSNLISNWLKNIKIIGAEQMSKTK